VIRERKTENLLVGFLVAKTGVGRTEGGFEYDDQGVVRREFEARPSEYMIRRDAL
jgi:hypothetical protein